jgi:hypothetical protein
LSCERKESGKVVVLEDRAQGITQDEVGIPLGKGGTGYTGGFFRHRLQGMWA